MPYPVSISEAAEADVREAFLWYEKQREGLGEVFRLHFTEAVVRIGAAPLEIQVRYANTRVLFLHKFPYGIHFVLRNDSVVIVAVFHTSMSTERWKGR
jgi:plasmid stabilization system protein ParE